MRLESVSDRLETCTATCPCAHRRHDPRLVCVLTGGPGAGKIAVLEMTRRSLCGHVVILPEAAGIDFGGGSPRLTSPPACRAAQHAIFCVQRQLERIHLEEGDAAVVLCDRGTLDGTAYWPGNRDRCPFAEAWHDHPNRTIIDATVNFPTKAQRALAAERPACCSPEYS